MKKPLLTSLILCMLLIQGCDPVKFWNGYYSMQSSIRKYDKERDDYYAKETPAQKALRKKNSEACRQMAMDTYPPIINASYEINSERTDKRWAIEEKCMEERGSPLF